jgi:hypothetical protein
MGQPEPGMQPREAAILALLVSGSGKGGNPAGPCSGGKPKCRDTVVCQWAPALRTTHGSQASWQPAEGAQLAPSAEEFSWQLVEGVPQPCRNRELAEGPTRQLRHACCRSSTATRRPRSPLVKLGTCLCQGLATFQCHEPGQVAPCAQDLSLPPVHRRQAGRGSAIRLA